MRYGHGSTSNSPEERRRRKEQPVRDRAREEQNLQRARGGGKPAELGAAQGQNAEQTGTPDPRNASESGKIRH